jgi:hypothetical protein
MIVQIYQKVVPDLKMLIASLNLNPAELFSQTRPAHFLH